MTYEHDVTSNSHFLSKATCNFNSFGPVIFNDDNKAGPLKTEKVRIMNINLLNNC